MGKSAAAQSFQSFGVPVFDADAAVHRLFAPGGGAVEAVTAAFPDCRDGQGGVDRGALGRRAFDDPAALARLEAIVHPLVQAAECRFLAWCAVGRHALAVLDVPLLFETGGEHRVDAVAVVSAPAVVQAPRVLRRPGMTAARLAAIQSRQTADADKRRRADFVIQTGLERRRSLCRIAGIIDAVRGRPGRVWPGRWTPCGARRGSC